MTGLLVGGPPIAVGLAIAGWWGDRVQPVDVVLLVVLYFVSGYGVTIGYHRLLTHRSFTANRALKISLAVAGSMAVEGSPISWVAAHRRHHRFSDRPGDPHSPNLHGAGAIRRLRGLLHAHVGWLFACDATSAERFAPDLQADEDLRRVGRWFPAIAVLSFALPFGIGWLWSGTLGGALSALLWGGLIRMMLLHHTTWSVNSLCHAVGKRPFQTRDRSSNVALLAVVSMGDSWHNLHHAYPMSARQGVLPHQLDSSAGLIRVFERLGWATDVCWPDPARLERLRRTSDGPPVDGPSLESDPPDPRASDHRPP
ncbi:MAG: acyl-CoA desaturase [Microthrixaceae bacterium]